jgi:hypothetical protein
MRIAGKPICSLFQILLTALGLRSVQYDGCQLTQHGFSGSQSFRYASLNLHSHLLHLDGSCVPTGVHTYGHLSERRTGYSPAESAYTMQSAHLR